LLARLSALSDAPAPQVRRAELARGLKPTHGAALGDAMLGSP
jgi:hypothetical protein